MTLLVTGSAGFVGTCVVRQLIAETDEPVASVDALTYAGNPLSFGPAAQSPRHHFEHADIRDEARMRAIFKHYQPRAILHLAAETHVDRSIHAPAEFVSTNIVGTLTLLQVAQDYWRNLPEPRRNAFRFQHISTDEVFGSLAPEAPAFEETTAYAPTSPYAASKAGSDHLVLAWQRTYGLPTLMTHCSNNYGPYHFPEKLIPLMILNAVDGKPLPVYGDGQHVRDWLFVEDHARALRLVLEHGTPGETYNVGGAAERRNIDVVNMLCSVLDELQPSGAPHARLITYVKDRPGHDRRYAINFGKLERELGWRPRESFETGLRKTVRWYLANPGWVASVRSGGYRNWLDKNYGSREAE